MEGSGSELVKAQRRKKMLVLVSFETSVAHTNLFSESEEKSVFSKRYALSALASNFTPDSTGHQRPKCSKTLLLLD